MACTWCRVGLRCRTTKVRSNGEWPTFEKMLSRVGTSHPWLRKTIFLVIGKAVSPTSASMARHVSKWLPVLKRSGLTSNHYLNRSLPRSEEHTSELQSLRHLVCRLLLEKKNK